MSNSERKRKEVESKQLTELSKKYDEVKCSCHEIKKLTSNNLKVIIDLLNDLKSATLKFGTISSIFQEITNCPAYTENFENKTTKAEMTEIQKLNLEIENDLTRCIQKELYYNQQVEMLNNSVDNYKEEMKQLQLVKNDLEHTVQNSKHANATREQNMADLTRRIDKLRKENSLQEKKLQRIQEKLLSDNPDEKLKKSEKERKELSDRLLVLQGELMRATSDIVQPIKPSRPLYTLEQSQWIGKRIPASEEYGPICQYMPDTTCLFVPADFETNLDNDWRSILNCEVGICIYSRPIMLPNFVGGFCVYFRIDSHTKKSIKLLCGFFEDFIFNRSKGEPDLNFSCDVKIENIHGQFSDSTKVAFVMTSLDENFVGSEYIVLEKNAKVDTFPKILLK